MVAQPKICVVGSVAIVTLEFSSFESVIMRGHLNN